MFPRLNNNPARHLYILELGYDRPIGHYAPGIAFRGNRPAKAQTRPGMQLRRTGCYQQSQPVALLEGITSQAQVLVGSRP